MSRSSDWLEIWEKNYLVKAKKDLHVSAGYDGLELAEWKRLTGYFIDQIAMKPGSDVLEVGCGSGAFLREFGKAASLSGIDYSSKAIEKVAKALDGDFRVAAAHEIPFDDHSFDVVVSLGVFFYFDSLEYARSVIEEMFRVVKPDGKVFIGEINDLEKKETAEKRREESDKERQGHRVSDKQVDHLYYSKQFFTDIAEEKGLDIRFIDHDVKELDFYYNADYRFSVIYSRKTA